MHNYFSFLRQYSFPPSHKDKGTLYIIFGFVAGLKFFDVKFNFFSNYNMITLFKKLASPHKNVNEKVHFYSSNTIIKNKAMLVELHPGEEIRYHHPTIHDVVEIDDIPYYVNLNLTTKKKIQLNDGQIVYSQDIGITPNGKISRAVTEDIRYVNISTPEKANKIANYIRDNYKDHNSTIQPNKAIENYHKAIKGDLNKAGFDDERINFPINDNETCEQISKRIDVVFGNKTNQDATD